MYSSLQNNSFILQENEKYRMEILKSHQMISQLEREQSTRQRLHQQQASHSQN